MDIIYETIRNICAFVILTTVVNNLLHESSYQKYVRFFSGLVLILIVITLVTKLLSNDTELFDSIEKYLKQVQTNELEQEFMLEEERAGTDATKKYTEMLDQSLEYLVNEQGMKLIESSWDLNLNSNEDNYGQIAGLHVKASMSEDVDLSDVIIDEEGNVSVSDEPNGSLSSRSSKLSEVIASYYCINEDVIVVDVIP